MEKRTLVILIVAGLLLIAGIAYKIKAVDYETATEAGNIATGQASLSSRYAGKVAPGTPLGEQVGAQMQKAESLGQEKLQATQPMQRAQQVRTQAQQPTSAVTSRFGGGRFF